MIATDWISIHGQHIVESINQGLEMTMVIKREIFFFFFTNKVKT